MSAHKMTRGALTGPLSRASAERATCPKCLAKREASLIEDRALDVASQCCAQCGQPMTTRERLASNFCSQCIALAVEENEEQEEGAPCASCGTDLHAPDCPARFDVDDDDAPNYCPDDNHSSPNR